MIKDAGGIKKLVKKYYRGLRQAIKTGCFDVVAHFDLIKTWNRDGKYFSGEEDWYEREVSETLRLINKKNMKIDLNSSGLRKACGEQYPSLKILGEAKGLGVGFLVGTDAHEAGEMECGLGELIL